MTRAQAISRFGWAAAERWRAAWDSPGENDPTPFPRFRLFLPIRKARP